MNVDRRAFLKSAAAYGAVSAAGPAAELFGSWHSAPSYIGLHPFIEKHPEAVFIRRTHVAAKDDADGKKREAMALARQIFALRRKPGIPLTNKFVFKPNLTSAKGTGLTHAIVTDPYVVEGFVEGLKQGTVAAGNIYLREGLSTSQAGTGFVELSQRSGAHYGDSDSRMPTLKECPDGVVFRRTKYLGPFNYPDSTLINFSKFKTHSMGLTLCVKNLQGTNVPPYIRFCGGLQNVIAQDFQPDAQKHVDDLFEIHRRAGLPRWHTEKGAWMEMWIQRTLDHYALIRPTIGLNIIDAVYAQNGDGFDGGPGVDGAPEIFLTNMLVFGKDAFRVDIIGHWLGGHEPGNFGLFHIGRERKVSTALNPRNIPVYVWEDKGPRLTPLESLTRTPLKTPYLPKSDEPRFHLCDEPFAYPPEKVSASLTGRETPGFEVLGRNQPVHGDPSLVVEYNLPSDGYASLDLYSASGERVGILAEGRQFRGVHVAAWDLRRHAPEIRYCRLRCDGFDQASRVVPIG